MHSSGVAERSPAWSPDGESIAFFDDSTGEYELYVMPAKGKGEKRALTTDGGPFKESITWSPDSKKLTYGDKTGSLWLVTLADSSRVLVDRDPRASTPNPSFSHDGAWITYTRRTLDRDTPQIYIYEVATGTSTAVTSGMFSDSTPTFDSKGDFLVFASERTFSPTYSALDSTWIYTDAQQLFLVPLRKDVKMPWAAESDEEEKQSEKKDEEKKDGDKKEDAKKDTDKPADDAPKKDADKKENGDEDDGPSPKDSDDPPAPPPEREPNDPPAKSETETIQVAQEKKSDDTKEGDKKTEPAAPIQIDLDGFENRAVALPMKSGGYGSLAFNDKNLLLFARSKEGIKIIDLTDKEKKEKKRHRRRWL